MAKFASRKTFLILFTILTSLASADTVTVSPVWAKWAQQDNLTAVDTNSGDHFGFAAAVDGNTAVVGARYADPCSDDEGAVYIYDFNGLAWSQQQKLIASDAQANAYLGCSIAIDGNTIVAGAYKDDHSSKTDPGSAYVFTRSGSTWSQQQKLTAPSPENTDYFGYSVAVDGNTIVVGAYKDDHSGISSAGSAYVYTFNGSTWSLQDTLTASDAAASDFLGYSVSIDGNTAVIGAHWADPCGWESGAAYIFTRSGSSWSQQKKLTGSDSSDYDEFGCSVAIDGNTVVIGARVNDHSGKGEPGAAYVFTGSGSQWSEQEKLIDESDPCNDDNFGCSVAIEGDRVIIGAQEDLIDGYQKGGAFSFVRDGTDWSQEQWVTASDGADEDRFGCSVSLSGEHLIVGAFRDDNDGTNSGSVYMYLLTCAADLNVDGVVDFVDFAILAGQWFQPSGSPSADIAPFPAGDNVVNMLDLLVLTSQWLAGTQ